MTDSQALTEAGIEALVAALPEKYQPIYGMPGLSDGSSRSCEDRLGRIQEIASALEAELGRPLRVLDLGSAQGFFSLNLAARGYSVRGIDFLQQNVDVCRELARLHGLDNARFECGLIEDAIGGLMADQYDLVLGLSVFHHLVHQHGLSLVVALVTALAQKVRVGIYELALREEPLYWAPSQPEDPAGLLGGYAFERVLSVQGTHLSGIARPLYFASNRYWYLGGQLRPFDAWRQEPHGYAMGSHQGTRRYYFGNGVMAKRLSLGNADLTAPNLAEYRNEVAFLAAGGAEGFRAPALLFHENDGRNLWLVREALPGEILSELISRHVAFAYEPVIDGLLDQLVALEAAGLYHNDVRCWNVLVSDDGVSLIDYGAISADATDCTWPGNLILAFLITVREVVHSHLVEPFPIRRPQLNVAVLPVRYRNAFIRLFALDRKEWSYRRLREFIREDDGLPLPVPTWNELVAVMERGAGRLEEVLASSRQQERDLAGRLEGGVERWRAESARFEAEAVMLREYQSEAGAQLASARQQIQELQGENAGLHERQASLAAELAECQGRAVRLENLAANLRQVHDLSAAELESFEEKTRLARRVSNEADAKALALQAELNASLSNAHHWYLRATEFEQQLEQIHASSSWRLTRPFRGISRLVRHPRQYARAGALGLMHRAQRHPALMRAAGRLTKLVPPLHGRLVGLALGHGVGGSAPQAEPMFEPHTLGQVLNLQGMEAAEARERLSIRGRMLYAKMKENGVKDGSGAQG